LRQQNEITHLFRDKNIIASLKNRYGYPHYGEKRPDVKSHFYSCSQKKPGWKAGSATITEFWLALQLVAPPSAQSGRRHQPDRQTE
jgi:hypothetical protein